MPSSTTQPVSMYKKPLHFQLHGEKGMSRKFWSGGKIGPGDQNFWNIGPGGPFFPENFGPPAKIMVRPAP